MKVKPCQPCGIENPHDDTLRDLPQLALGLNVCAARAVKHVCRLLLNVAVAWFGLRGSFLGEAALDEIIIPLIHVDGPRLEIVCPELGHLFLACIDGTAEGQWSFA